MRKIKGRDMDTGMIVGTHGWTPEGGGQTWLITAESWIYLGNGEPQSNPLPQYIRKNHDDSNFIVIAEAEDTLDILQNLGGKIHDYYRNRI